MKTLIPSCLLMVLVLACTSFDISDNSASIRDPKPTVQRVAVIDFDFARPEEGRTDRGRITRPMNAGSIMADIFAEHLLGSGLYEVVERRKVIRLMRDLEIDAADLFAADNMMKMQQVLKIEGLVVGVVTEYGDWRGTLNWGGVVSFSARLVQVDTGALIWAASANRDMAMTNSTAIAHAASQDALEDLIAKLGR
jgi:curli biogenesis system outer membrane secretion channel CsgG